MSTPTGPQDPRIPHQNGAVPQADQQQPQAPTQPGYGYPPTQYPRPAQQGYPYEIRPGVPQFPQPQPYVPNPAEPDWSALADQHVAERKRKRLLIIGVSAVLVIAVAGAAALFLMGGSKKDDDNNIAKQHTTGPAAPPSASADSSPSTASPSGKPSSTPSPTMQGRELFAAETLPVDGQTYTRRTTSHEVKCWKATRGGLGPMLGPNKCSQIVLATYTSKKSSVTVGVLVFPSAKEANAVDTAFKGELIPLTGKPGIPHFCQKVPCAVTHAVHDHYVYTTIAGPNSGKAGDKDATSVAAGHGIAGYTLSRLLELH
jgi:hypothetical protein